MSDTQERRLDLVPREGELASAREEGRLAEQEVAGQAPEPAAEEAQRAAVVPPESEQESHHHYHDGCDDDHCGCGDEHCACDDDHCGCGDEHCGCEQREASTINEQNVSFTYQVKGLDCPSCAKQCENAVRLAEGVADAELNYATGQLLVSKEPGALDAVVERSVLAAVRSCGHDLDLSDEKLRELEAELPWFVEHREELLMGASGVLLAAGLVLEHLVHAELPAKACYVISALCGLVYVAPMAYYALRRKTADMNVLMSIAVVGALLMGAHEEAAMVIFLDQVGEWLEGWSMRKSRGNIARLMELAPDTAHLVQADGTLRDVEADDVEEGSLIRVLPGERVPLDGVIERGTSSFNEAPITGESVPQDKGVGAQAFAGSLNEGSVVELRTTSDADESTLARIVSMVQGAQAAKAPYEAFIDRFAAVYTPIVVAGALIVGLVVPLLVGLFGGFENVNWGDWVFRALSLLVVACPCALVISTPVSFVSAISRAAQDGVLVKGGACFDVAAHLNAIAFDKTGTLTQGAPRLERVACVDGASLDEVLAVALALEAGSTHPLARAVCAYGEQAGQQPREALDVCELAAHGVSGVVDGGACVIGKPGYVRGQVHDARELDAVVATLEGQGYTVLAVAREGRALGALALADAPRAAAKPALEELRALGVGRLHMLTGDNARVADAVAAELGLDSVSAGCLPDDKVNAIHDLQKSGVVAMVGDGINDAPALAAADLGITMGAASSDTALEVADVALLSDDLTSLPLFLRLARHTMLVVRENITFAILVKALVFVLVVGGWAGMGAAVFADTGVALIVILNGLRLMLRVRRG